MLSRVLSNWSSLIGQDDIITGMCGNCGSRPEVPRHDSMPRFPSSSLQSKHSRQLSSLQRRLLDLLGQLRACQHELAKGCAAVAAAMYVSVLLLPALFHMELSTNRARRIRAVASPSALTSSMARFASPAAIATGRYLQMRYALFS